MVARKLSEIAAQLGLILQGDDAEVIGVNTLEGAGPDEVSFLANPKYADQLAATRAGAVIGKARQYSLDKYGAKSAFNAKKEKTSASLKADVFRYLQGA